MPSSVESLFFQATEMMEEGDAAGAESVFRHALQISPDFAEAHANLGLLLDRQGSWPEAENHYRRALELNPLQSQTHLNLGAMLIRQKRLVAAQIHLQEAVELDPESPGSWSNLGALLACMKQEAAAERCLRSAIAIDPGYRKASFNLAYLLLQQGRFKEGWQRLEARDWYAPLDERLPFPRWRGESLQDKSLLIGFEAGHGDMIQFCRYAALAKRAGAAHVAVLCQPGLKSLLARLSGVDHTISLDEAWPAAEFDYWVPPLSLPLRFDTRLDTIPAELPYLSAEPERLRRWADATGQEGFRVGLVWKGNPRFENDADRSLPSVDTLSPLAAVAGVRFFSLQKETNHSASEPCPVPAWFADLGSSLGDFADTAAIVMNLDLVISVDTAVAHLAGALGKPCWVMLPDYKPDWRWLRNRDDTPWYPGVMRLFRQQRMGDWSWPVEQMRAALHEVAGKYVRTA